MIRVHSHLRFITRLRLRMWLRFLSMGWITITEMGAQPIIEPNGNCNRNRVINQRCEWTTKGCSHSVIASAIFYHSKCRIKYKCSCGAIATMTLNSIQPINCDKQIAVTIAPCECTVRVYLHLWLVQFLPPRLYGQLWFLAWYWRIGVVHKWVLYQYLPAATNCGQGNIFAPVCHSVHGGGVSASVHAGIPHPPWEQTHPLPTQEQTPTQSRHPLEADTPQSRHTPGSRCPPKADPPEQTPPGADTPQEQTTPRDQTPPWE